MQVAIQGFKGCFHEVALQKFYGKQAMPVYCATFRELATIVQSGKADAGIMAIENSIAGSILANYNLLEQTGLHVWGEIYIQIQQHLLANPGVELAHIKEVHSHPMALQQCANFFSRYNFKLVETEDTALSAKHVSQYKSKHIAAVAGSLAAKLYGLNTLAASIQTVKNNYTRFLVLQNKKQQVEDMPVNKASFHFGVTHERGSLGNTLLSIAQAGGNLTKLQSFPIAGSTWQYAFYADVEFEDLKVYNHIQTELDAHTSFCKTLGIYKSGLNK